MTWAIGNGESRTPIDIANLSGYKIGCNAIFRDYAVDELICVDKKMVYDALENNFYKTIRTRQDWINRFTDYKNVVTVPDLPYTGEKRQDDPFQWGSGPYAILRACELSDTINIIGFDLYSKTEYLNNVYKDTFNYDRSLKRPVDPSYWIYQIHKLFNCFKDKHFVIYQEEDWTLPKLWKGNNVSLDKISNIV